MTTRQILHLDLDAFFCAVEELRHPELHGKPFAVGGRPEGRGVVSSCSYAAREMGVHSAMPMAHALRLCPDLIVISGRHRFYQIASRQVMTILRSAVPLVQQISVDEAFMDVSCVTEDLSVWAHKLQSRVQMETGLPSSLGGASNKLVAKIATEVGKAGARGGEYPRAVTIVPPGKEAEFLAPLPVRMLWGVGPKTAARLEDWGIHTIGGLARWPENELTARFGKMGAEMAMRARGIDSRPVVSGHAPKSISNETTFARDVQDAARLREILRHLALKVAGRLQRDGWLATTVKIKVRWSDFTTLSRQISVQFPVADEKEIFELAENLFDLVWQPGQAVRLLGVGVSGLQKRPRQLALWDAHSQKEGKLAEALADLQRRFGNGVIIRGKKNSNSSGE